LRSRGVTYLDVLAGLGDLGLRPPLAPMEGRNVEAREPGRRRLRASGPARGREADLPLAVTDTSPLITLRLSARRVFWITDYGSSRRGRRSANRLRVKWPNLIRTQFENTPVRIIDNNRDAGRQA
jgi:hypothetical protein